MLSAMPVLAAPKLEASLDRDAISLGEGVTFSLTFDEAAPGDLNLPNMPDFDIGATGRSQSTEINGNQMTQKTVFTFELRPRRAGDLMVPAFAVDAAGIHLVSQSIKLKVFNGQVPGTENIANASASIKVVAPKKEMYLGEVMTVDVQCHSIQESALQGGEFQMPQLAPDGFVVGLMPMANYQNTRQSSHTINGKHYSMLSFRMSVKPVKTGTLKLGPATWNLSLLGNPQRNIFGQVQYTSRQQIEVTNQPEDIVVLPLPTDGVPEGFSGAVGEFSLQQYEASPSSVAVGDPVTLKIRINGSGSFDAVKLPSDQAEWREFKAYPATSKFETQDALNISGSKYFEQVVTPQNAEIKAVPAFKFSFFSPTRKAYQTLERPPIALAVHPTVATPQPSVAGGGQSPEAPAAASQEIAHIKTSAGDLVTAGRPWLRQPGFLALQALAPLLWIGALLWRRRQDWLSNNPRALRQREVARIVEQGLQELPRLAQENKTDEFYATLVRLLQEQLGERLDVAASGITEDALDNLPANVSGETAAALRELFHTCNQYRYAPGKTNAELQKLVAKAAAALRELQTVPAVKKSRATAVAVVIGAMLLTVGAAHADAFNDASKLYEEGKYAEAAAAYDKIVQGGKVSPALYFNLGNAFFKANQPGRAIHAYREAESLSPRDPDVRANLQFARKKAGAGAPALPGNRWTRMLNHLSLNEWTGMTSVVVAILFLFLAVGQFRPESKPALFGVTIAAAIVSIGLLICLSLMWNQTISTKSAVVTASEAVIRKGPFDESQSSFTAHDGAELLVLDQKEKWLEVEDGSHRSGWVLERDVAVIK